MGVEDNDFQISDLTSNTSFFEWASKTNTDIIGKLNRMRLYDGISGDGINVVVGSATITEAGTPTATSITAGDIFVEMSGTVEKGVTFNGDVTVNGTLNYDFTQAFGGVKTVSIGFSGGTAGFTAGDVVRYDADLGGVTFARADSPTNAEVLGIVNGERNNEVSVVTQGLVEFNSIRFGGLSAGCIHFLSPTNHGELTNTEPTVIGQVSKPLFLATGSTSGVFFNYRGQHLAGTGGTGDTNADNNAFFLTQASSGLSSFADFTVGRVVSYDGSWKITKNSDAGSLNSIIGVIVAKPNSTTVKIITSGFVNESPVNAAGPLFVDGDGNLTPTSTGSPVVAVGSLVGSDYALVVNPSLGEVSGFNGGVPSGSQQYSRSAPANLGGVTATTGGVSYVNDNLIPNGSFSIWQRGIGVGSAFTGTGSTYFADRWVRLNRTNVDIAGSTGSGSLSLERKDFTTTQTDVEGNPLYYARFNTTIAGNTYNDIIHVENRVEGSDTLRGENVTLGFYAKANSAGKTATIFVKQNTDGTSTETKTNIADIRLPNNDWQKFVTVFEVPELTVTPSGNHYFAVGLDITHSGQVDLAQFKLERGVASTPVQPRTIESEYDLCARYYQRSYAPDVATRTKTFVSNSPDATSVNFAAVPAERDFYERFPTRMRGTPAVTLYSPFSGETGEAYNRSFGDDLATSSGSRGFAGNVRVAPAGATTITTDATSKDGFLIQPVAGLVDYDRISVHYVADADLNNNIS